MIRAICIWLSLLLLALLALPMARAVPFFSDASSLPSLLSFRWEPAASHFGLLLALVGSFQMVLLSLPLTFAVAWALAYQLAHTRLDRLRSLVISVLQMANSIPSVVIGIWGVEQLVPAVRRLNGTGYCILTTTLGLVVLTLPTTCLLVLQAYQEYRRRFDKLERSLGFGWWDSTTYFLRSSRGEMRHVWLFVFCRLFGETTVVLMLSGNSILLASSPFQGFRTLTSSIALEMAYATGRHEQSLYVLAAVSILCTGAAIVFGPTQRLRAAGTP